MRKKTGISPHRERRFRREDAATAHREAQQTKDTRKRAKQRQERAAHVALLAAGGPSTLARVSPRQCRLDAYLHRLPPSTKQSLPDPPDPPDPPNPLDPPDPPNPLDPPDPPDPLNLSNPLNPCQTSVNKFITSPPSSSSSSSSAFGSFLPRPRPQLQARPPLKVHDSSASTTAIPSFSSPPSACPSSLPRPRPQLQARPPLMVPNSPASATSSASIPIPFPTPSSSLPSITTLLDHATHTHSVQGPLEGSSDTDPSDILPWSPTPTPTPCGAPSVAGGIDPHLFPL